MKKILFISLVLISQTILAQDSSGKKNNFVGGSHGKLVLFTGFDLEAVINKFGNYLRTDLKYSDAEDTRKPNTKVIYASYSKRISSSNTKLQIAYNGKWVNNSYFVIDNCSIEGNWMEVAELFIKYWETKMNFDEMKGSPVIKYTVSDKITFSTLPNGKAKIVISKNT